MKKFFVIMMAALSAFFVGCDFHDDAGNKVGINDHMIVERGIVEKIIYNKTILMQIDKQYGKYTIGEQIYVEYGRLSIESEMLGYDQELCADITTLKLGDHVGIQYFSKTEEQKDGLDFYQTDTLYKDIYSTHGPVKEICDDGTVLVELNDIIFARIYEPGTIVKVKYDKLVPVMEETSATDSAIAAKAHDLKVGDEVIVVYDQTAKEQKDGYDYFDLPELYQVLSRT
ncbi:MAG: hypothetical protein QM689_05490 [Oscillospiraceae bacterium]